MFSHVYSHNERNIPLDALRGFALFGVFMANIFLFNSYTGNLHAYVDSFPDELNQTTGIVIQYFFRGRFYPIFAFLFGLGMGMQFLRQHSAEAGIRFLIRRLFVLLLIGLLHYLHIWDGDILIRYSLVGMLALLFISLRPKLILIAATVFYTLHSFYTLQSDPAPILPNVAEDAIIQMTYPQLILYRLKELPLSYGTVESIFYSIKVFVFILLGLYFGKHFMLQANNKYNWSRLLFVLIVIRLATALVTYLYPNTEGVIFLSFINYLLNSSIYVTGFMFLANLKLLHRATFFLAYVGRMSLTNYLLQNLTLAFIFYGYGLNQYQEWQPWLLVLFSTLLFILQGCMSYWWFKYHRQGPAERLWRHFTYVQAKHKMQVK